MARHGTLGAILLDALHVSVGIGDELQHLVSHVRTLSAEHLNVLIVAEDPGVLEHLINLHSLIPILDE